MIPIGLQKKLDARIKENALRTLKPQSELVDFSSNDYLGFSKEVGIYEEAHEIVKRHDLVQNGSTGSRLLSGNHALFASAEAKLAKTYNSEDALIFNSGYDANVGFFSSVPGRLDTILYDEYVHASIRDGIQMSHARSIKFKHNDLDDLQYQIDKLLQLLAGHIYVVTESVFSMDGDSPDLRKMARICRRGFTHLVVDEAHAVGVLGQGYGLVEDLALSQKVLARIVTFGKAMGCHGAAVLCSEALKSYLVNFSRSLIYTTAMPPHGVATIQASHEVLGAYKNTDDPRPLEEVETLQKNIKFFKKEYEKLNLQEFFIPSETAIQSAVISGNERVKEVSEKLKLAGFSVLPILSPTVPAGEERLRFCLHTYNSQEEMKTVLALLAKFVA